MKVKKTISSVDVVACGVMWRRRERVRPQDEVSTLN